MFLSAASGNLRFWVATDLSCCSLLAWLPSEKKGRRTAVYEIWLLKHFRQNSPVKNFYSWESVFIIQKFD